jgi:hypothetical protein
MTLIPGSMDHWNPFEKMPATLYNGIVPSNEEELFTGICDNMDEQHKHQRELMELIFRIGRRISDWIGGRLLFQRSICKLFFFF